MSVPTRSAPAPPALPLLRSMLFVPGDSERKLVKSVTSDADALILDLEDSIAATRRPHARQLVNEFLMQRDFGRATAWVRINALASPECLPDLASTVAARPHGIVLPKTRSANDVTALAERLAKLEAESGIEIGTTKILPIATETPASLFALEGYSRCGPRLVGLTWGAEDLSAALGATQVIDGRGEWLAPYQLVRSLTLFAAAAAGVAAIDTVHTQLRDTEGLARQARAALRDGFIGKLAIHPDQVATLNQAFQPDSAAIAAAQRIVAAFDDAVGVVAVDGKMLDRPHLLRAQRTLALAAALKLHP